MFQLTRKAIKNLYNLLGKDGTLLISSPNRPITSPQCKTLSDKPGGFHEQEFTPGELTYELNNAGFIVNNPIYGQRQQQYLPSPLLRWFYNCIFKPYRKFSPDVSPVTTLVPRYFILVAQKK